MIYVRSGRRAGPWHVALSDGRTVCGAELAKWLRAEGLVVASTAGRDLCGNCDRMKDADTIHPFLATSADQIKGVGP